MSDVFTSAGTRLYIGPTVPDPYNQAGFEAIGAAWVEVEEAVDMGELGREYNLVTHNALNNRRTVKRKGSYNDGTVSLQLARVPADAGQTAIIAALDSDNSFPFRIVLQEGTTLYFSAQVMSYTTAVGSVDQITGANANLEIDGDIIEVGGS